MVREFFLNLPIKKKILYSFFCVLFLFAVVAYIAIGVITDATDGFSVYHRWDTNQSLTSEIQAHLLNGRIAANKFLMTKEQQQSDLAVGHFQSIIDLVKKKNNEILEPERRQRLLQMGTDAEAYVSAYQVLVNQTLTLGQAEQANVQKAAVIGEEIFSAITELDNSYRQDKTKMGLELEAKNSSGKRLITIVSIIAILLGVFFAIMVGNAIVKVLLVVVDRVRQLKEKCIKNLEKGLNALAMGDTGVEVKYETPFLELTQKDEIGDLARSVDGIITQTRAGIESFENTRRIFSEVMHETVGLIQAAKDGKLGTRGKAEQFNGSYRELVRGINETLDAVIDPVKEGTAVLAEMAQGNLTVRVNGDFKGDHQLIKNSINGLGDSLLGLISDVTEAVQATASATTQISSSSEELAAGAQEQSAQTGEIASAVEQMAKTIVSTTRNATAAANSAKKAGEVALEGDHVVKETIAGMIKISDVVNNAAKTVQELGKSSDQIGEIVQVIDEIADQTNLLALNAAIEAARAGEQGRGFAVVADEVRKLAERTTKATKEIAVMIRQIQKDTSNAVVSMERGTIEVESGKVLAQKAGHSLNGIIQSAEEVVDVANQVAAASEEQASAAEQISKNIEGITEVTQQSAQSTQEIAKAAEDLNRLTERLQNLIGRFQVETTTSGLRTGVRQLRR
jgi:methyl-accepting chemotaxis protein